MRSTGDAGEMHKRCRSRGVCAPVQIEENENKRIITGRSRGKAEEKQERCNDPGPKSGTGDVFRCDAGFATGFAMSYLEWRDLEKRVYLQTNNALFVFKSQLVVMNSPRTIKPLTKREKDLEKKRWGVIF